MKHMAQLNDSVFISKTEVSNHQYNEFLVYEFLRNHNDVVEASKRNPELWNEPNQHNQPFVEYYSSHPAYQSYPVVNISYEGAINFCKWLTQLNNTNSDIKVTYRLPTKAEWIAAAQAGDPNAEYPWEGSDLTNKKDQARCNYKRGHSESMGVAGQLNDNADITAPVTSYWPNELGIYNMSGNVAEMIQGNERTMGGDWSHAAEYLKINGSDANADTPAPAPTIGFRYVMVVHN